MSAEIRNLLVANRGEIAIRILRAAAEMGLRTVAVHSDDDDRCLHVRKADESWPLGAEGVAAYLDGDRILEIARQTGCDAIHPGYGFLAESAAFAEKCAEAGVRFVGPSAEVLGLLGDKTAARELATRCGVPVLPGTAGPTSLEEAHAFLGDHGAIVVKAIAGGGGRGMRIVDSPNGLDDAFERCRSEAESAFGNGDLYVERFLTRARHVEVQIIGDGSGEVIHAWERECTLQRRHQKVVEVAPAPDLPDGVRERLTEAAVRMAAEVRYAGLGTFEFLLDAQREGEIFFIEANPRLQVEHTVTEEVLGLDLVQTQLRLASGRTLAQLGLDQEKIGSPRGFAIELRINTETVEEDGTTHPAAGTITAFEGPTGPGVRLDTHAYRGYATNPRFDPLLAKLIVRSASSEFRDAVSRAARALAELRIEGVATNVEFLRALLARPDVAAHRIHTRFVEDHGARIAAAAKTQRRRLHFEDEAPAAGAPGRSGAGARVDPNDPLAVLAHGKRGLGEAADAAAVAHDGPPGTIPVVAPMQGTIVSVTAAEGEVVAAGRPLVVMEAMKMEHEIPAPATVVVKLVVATKGDTVLFGSPLAYVEETDAEGVESEAVAEVDPDAIRPDLAEVVERHRFGFDEARPEAVERRRKTGQRTARENVEDLCDPGTFVEYGPLALAAQRRRRSLDDLIEKTPADGLLAGVGRVNGDLFPAERSSCVVMSYDYTVLAGTQGFQNHRKKDRMFEIAARQGLPVVFFTEGGGGRPGDTDSPGVAGLDCLAFNLWGKLSGQVPLVGINSGRCFAGNAAILGCCDVVIATKSSNIGMGGPAMIEGGGLGVFRPEDVGPMSVQVPNGVVDVAVADEAEGVAVAKKYLAYFQGSLARWDCADPRSLRHAIPENRLRVYDVRKVIDGLADTGSVLELRRGFGAGMVTVLARIEGRAIGIVANDPTHLAGAIDAPGADKAARFLQLCDAFDVPILFLCDTPGIMVGPEVETTAVVRHASRLFVVGASLTVPFFTIILRKGYGLGAQAMAGGSFKAGLFCVSWPTGEFGGMGLEGAVKLGFRKEIAAVEDPEERKALFEKMVEQAYEHGKAVNMASHFEIDEVIDPADSRRWITEALVGAPEPGPRKTKKRPCIDTW